MVTVIDYDAGNLKSVETALRRLGTRFTISGDAAVVRAADRIILPGVGDARSAMTRLEERGVADALHRRTAAGVPTLGICLGTQIILDSSEENDAVCLGIVPGRTVAFTQRRGIKIPHMGWNTVEIERTHPLFSGIPAEASFYFVHSYYPRPASSSDLLATTEYGERFPSALAHDSVAATQFHPEKSGEFGLRLLENFLSWDGEA